MTADVLPAVLFKQYRYFYALNNEGFDEGLEFADATGNYTINYPKLHIKNGEAKNSAPQTNGQYKPSVRMFKNARNCMIDKRIIQGGIAPSYFVECLLYNVPNPNYRPSLQETYYNVVKCLLGTQMFNFTCQNGQLALFGTAATQWSLADAQAFVNGLATLWDNW